MMTFLKKYWLTLAGLAVGALGGWLYWRFIGCLGGTCPIWSNAWIATGYGALLGWLLVNAFPRRKKSDDSRNTSEEGSRA